MLADTPSSDSAITIAPNRFEIAPLDINETNYFNRELSWLAFNARVLSLAADPDTPLLERVKYLAIYASNLDEFFHCLLYTSPSPRDRG